jgi:membrane-associated protease RseP (regulator of RpoE activity)
MASFVFYDLIFLALFLVIGIVFFYKKRKNWKRQGLLYLYRTNIGLKIMNWVAVKYRKILKPMEYVIVTSGYFLMAVALWFTFKIVSWYTDPSIIRAIKVPPIIPLFPYLPSAFNLDFLPPFYFTYFIVVLAIIAVSHEFAHGIFARLNKIKVHASGFGFLGPFLAAFVEPDEKQMNKAKKFPQLSILAAGTFANVIMTILFALILWGFFASSFSPAGVNFNAYPNSVIELASITAVSGININGLEDVAKFAEEGDKLTEIVIDDVIYLVPGDYLRVAVEGGAERLGVFEDAPAIRSGFKGPILEINDKTVRSPEELRDELSKYNPGDVIEITTLDSDEKEEILELTLGERDGKAYLGIGFAPVGGERFIGIVISVIGKVKDPFIHYEPIGNSNFAWFIYNLLWWIVLINLSVAVVNMLPVGIFDGGRFFYLTVWGITGRESWGKKAYAFSTWLLIAIVIWLMIQWTLAVF